jgi:hypothetical protein
MPPIGHARRFLITASLAGIAAMTGVSSTAQPSTTQPSTQTRRILVLPTIQWDKDGVAWQYGSQQTATNLARVMGDLRFGLIPEEVNQHLPNPAPDLHWSDLPVAGEFPEDVRYVWMPMRAAGQLRAPVTSCFGEASYVVLLFRTQGLFRVSWRFMPDPSCPDPANAADDLYAAYVPIPTTVAVTAHYRTGYAAVVDVTDPGAGLLIAQRWQMRGQ